MKLISGGQTGVERAVLDFAMRRGMPYGGWCAKDGWAEDAVTMPGILNEYPALKTTDTFDPNQTIEWNIRDTEATLIINDFIGGDWSTRTEWAKRTAEKTHKPHLFLNVDQAHATNEAHAWLNDMGVISSLNITGPRASESGTIYDKTLILLGVILKVAT